MVQYFTPSESAEIKDVSLIYKTEREKSISENIYNTTQTPLRIYYVARQAEFGIFYAKLFQMTQLSVSEGVIVTPEILE